MVRNAPCVCSVFGLFTLVLYMRWRSKQDQECIANVEKLQEQKGRIRGSVERNKPLDSRSGGR